MKRMILIMLAMGLVFSPKAQADDGFVKLGRGMANVTSSWMELGNQPIQMAKTERWPIALYGGVFKGLAMMVVRIGVGVYEIVTFPLPWPNHYDTLLHPEYIIPRSIDSIQLEFRKVPESFDSL